MTIGFVVPAAVVIVDPQYIHTLPPTAAVVIAEPEHAVPPMGVGRRRVTVRMSWNVSNPCHSQEEDIPWCASTL